MEWRHWQAGPGVGAWLGSVDDVPGHIWPEWFARMDRQRQVRCRRLRRDRDKALCILADALARHALCALTGADPAAVAFARAPGGKPYAPGLKAEFSLSHSGSLVLCAGAPFPLGADLQRHKPVSGALLRRARQAGYDGQSEADFFRWWTGQEAAGKLSGQGLRLEPPPEGLWWSQGRLDGPEGAYSYSICARPETMPPLS